MALLHFGFGMAAGCFEVSLLASDKNNAHQHSVQEFSTFEIGIFSDSQLSGSNQRQGNSVFRADSNALLSCYALFLFCFLHKT